MRGSNGIICARNRIDLLSCVWRSPGLSVFTCAPSFHAPFSTFHSQRLENHYTTLGLKRDATSQQIKSQFYKLSKIYHPDLNSSHPSSTERFKKVSEAYGVLSNSTSRAHYDQQLSSSEYSSPIHEGWSYGKMSEDLRDKQSRWRATANYAWSTRRTATRSNRQRSRHSDPTSSHATSDFAENLNRFERLARRKNLYDTLSSRSQWSHAERPSEPKASPGRQAIQLAVMLSFILWLGRKSFNLSFFGKKATPIVLYKDYPNCIPV
ncbi:hypothetical protein O181_079655 [Austropuccinia psidii MF-1]|uniref:J domain-containing protein n=1 Tax=Austropuccinia psidii MF-1 TaxID=1389203 RepID=A0A9Q3FFB9_9BASI|nr:hypothetical protein [Austropuccinia psidii MF-1]